MSEQKSRPAALDLATLKRCVEGETVAIRSITRASRASRDPDKNSGPSL